MQVSLTEWRELRRNSLRGFASVRIGGLVIKDVAVHNANDRRWAQLPAKPMIGPDGVAKKGANGKTMYVPILEWSRRELQDAFSEGVIGAVEREHPGATSGE